MATREKPKGFGVRFDVSILDMGGDIASCQVTDNLKGNTAKVDFKITAQGKKLYAHALIRKGSDDMWVGDYINQISPLVCNQILKTADFLLINE